MNSMIITLIILLGVVLAFISGKVKMSMIGITTVFFLVVCGVLPAETAFGNFVNSNVLLLAAMFVVGAAIQKTSIITVASNFVEKFKDRPALLTFFTCLIGWLLAVISNGSIATVILLPIVASICDEIDYPRSKLLYPLNAVALLGSGAWFLGIGALNMSWSGVMLKLGAHNGLNINDFIIARLPFAIVMILYFTFIGPKLLPKIDNFVISKKENNKVRSKQKLSHLKDSMGMIIIAVTIILMIASSYIHVDSYIIGIAGALLLVITGVLDNKEALGSLNLNILMLIGGMLSLATALQTTGAGKIIGNAVASIAGHIGNHFILMGLFFFVSWLLVQFIGGLGAISILVPIWTLTCLQLGLDPRGAVLAAATASAMGFASPLCSRMLPAIMEESDLNLGQVLKSGIPITVVMLIMGAFVTQIIYPL